MVRVKGNKLLEAAGTKAFYDRQGEWGQARPARQEGDRNLHLTRTKFSALSQFAVGLDSDQGQRAVILDLEPLWSQLTFVSFHLHFIRSAAYRHARLSSGPFCGRESWS